MSLFLPLLVKVGSATLVAGAIVSAPLVTGYGKRSSSAVTETFNQNQKCFVIGIETSREDGQLLICEDSNYYLRDKSQKLTKIQSLQSLGSGKRVTITLEKDRNSKTLTLSDNKWSTLPNNMNFHRSCNLEGIQEQQSTLSCFFSERRTWNATINLISWP